MNLLITFYERESYYSVMVSKALLRHKAKYIYESVIKTTLSINVFRVKM